MPTMKCPKCWETVEATDEQLVSGQGILCSHCGAVVQPGTAQKPQDQMDFPSTAKDETVLNLNETVQELKRKAKGND